MSEKKDTRIGATQESLDELMAKINEAKKEARLAPPGEEYTKVAEYFVMPVMIGDAKKVLEIRQEEKDEICRRVGEEFLKSFSETGAQNWDMSWLVTVAKAGLAGMVRGMLAIEDPELKEEVMENQARVCWVDHLKHIKAWEEKYGIPSSPGTYTVDGAIMFLGNMLTLRDVERTRDTIFWKGNTKEAYDRCCCSIYRSGIIDEQLPEFCTECAVRLMRYQFEWLTGENMESEILKSLNCTNSDTCEFRLHLTPTIKQVDNPYKDAGELKEKQNK